MDHKMDHFVQEQRKGVAVNDSWVELQLSSYADPQTEESSDAIEKLLLEAQKESREASRAHSNASSRGSPHNSPKCPKSPKEGNTPPIIQEEMVVEGLTSIVQREVGTEWVWDWSSRPECIPPTHSTEFTKKYVHPTNNGRHRTVGRKKTVLSELSGLSVKSKVVLFLTHTGTLIVAGIVGAILMWMKTPGNNNEGTYKYMMI